MASATTGIVSFSDDEDDVRVIPETPTKADLDLEEEEEAGGVDILDVAGASFLYRIPRFPVVTINLRQIIFQAVLPDSSTVTYDGFIHEHSSLYGHDYPASIRVYEYCFVEVLWVH